MNAIKWSKLIKRFSQLKVIHMADGSKYTPLKDVGIGGIIVMRYSGVDQAEDLVEPVAGNLIFNFLIEI